MSVVAALQMASGEDVGENLRAAAGLIEEAARRGARLAVLPENFAFMGSDRRRLQIAEPAGAEGAPLQGFLSTQARRHGLWLVGGTVPLAAGDRAAAACLVYDDAGERVARYDKIHLFDVDVPGDDQQYRESRATAGGATPVGVETPLGRLGLAVCYDVRFPELTRRLAASGLDLLALPAAFTAVTGLAHWEVLVRARAIENQCLVVAAGQGGSHPRGRETFGHSMIVDGWGTVLDRLERGAGVVSARFDVQRQQRMRRSFPALEHRRLDTAETDR